MLDRFLDADLSMRSVVDSSIYKRQGTPDFDFFVPFWIELSLALDLTV